MFKSFFCLNMHVFLSKQNQNYNSMKSIILAGAFMLAALTNKTFAADPKVSPIVLQAFNMSFSHASNAQWSVVDKLYKVEFISGSEKSIAFFSGDGTLVATSRYITIENLPYSLQRSLIRRTISGSITELFEVQSDGQIDYYATVKQGNGQIILKSFSTSWNVYKRK